MIYPLWFYQHGPRAGGDWSAELSQSSAGGRQRCATVRGTDPVSVHSNGQGVMKRKCTFRAIMLLLEVGPRGCARI